MFCYQLIRLFKHELSLFARQLHYLISSLELFHETKRYLGKLLYVKSNNPKKTQCAEGGYDGLKN